MANLVNSGILPMVFVNEEDYGKINPGDRLVLKGIRSQVEKALRLRYLTQATIRISEP